DRAEDRLDEGVGEREGGREQRHGVRLGAEVAGDEADQGIEGADREAAGEAADRHDQDEADHRPIAAVVRRPGSSCRQSAHGASELTSLSVPTARTAGKETHNIRSRGGCGWVRSRMRMIAERSSYPLMLKEPAAG